MPVFDGIVKIRQPEIYLPVAYSISMAGYAGRLDCPRYIAEDVATIYSVLKDATGLAEDARKERYPTVRNATTNVIARLAANIPGPSAIR